MTRTHPWHLALLWLFLAAFATAGEFRHVGDYLLKSKLKITGDKSVPISIKPMLMKVYTDGIEIRVSSEKDEDAHSTFEIYRSDGIGRQRTASGALEVIPGVQAFTRSGGLFRHLRLSRESLTITAFPGVSDQTIVTYAVGVETAPESDGPKTDLPAQKPLTD